MNTIDMRDRAIELIQKTVKDPSIQMPGKAVDIIHELSAYVMVLTYSPMTPTIAMDVEYQRKLEEHKKRADDAEKKMLLKGRDDFHLTMRVDDAERKYLLEAADHEAAKTLIEEMFKCLPKSDQRNFVDRLVVRRKNEDKTPVARGNE